jgi:hypothetical protein
MRSCVPRIAQTAQSVLTPIDGDEALLEGPRQPEAQRNLVLARKLVRVLRLLGATSVPCRPFKRCLLAAVYGDRPSASSETSISSSTDGSLHEPGTCCSARVPSRTP